MLNSDEGQRHTVLMLNNDEGQHHTVLMLNNDGQLFDCKIATVRLNLISRILFTIVDCASCTTLRFLISSILSWTSLREAL